MYLTVQNHIRPFGQAECVEEIREPVEDIDLEKAEIVIGGGNGLGGRENFELLGNWQSA